MTSRLDSRSLALFLAVADSASYRQAAEQLHMSQPPLSRAIRELEERIGTQLFERHARGVTLTEAGRTLRPYATRSARLLRDAEAAMTALAARAAPRLLRLGLTSALEPAWLGRFMDAVGRSFGGQVLNVTHDSSPRLVRQLRSGRLDAACIALPTEAGGLDLVELDRLPMVAAVPTAHALSRRRSLRLSDLDGAPVYWFERARQPAFHDHCQRAFARHGFAPRWLREPHDHHVLLADVAAGKGIALLPASFTGLKRSGVAYRRLAEGDELSVGFGVAAPADRAALLDALARLARKARGA